MKRIMILVGLILMGIFSETFAHDHKHHMSSLSSLIEKRSFSELEGNQNKVLKKFQNWVNKRTERLESGSQIIDTPRGPIEYVLKGKGPIVLCLHGGFGGYDQGLLVGDSLLQHGFSILSPSRPGYLRTPLSVGATNEEQADAMVDLLNALGIDKVSVIGFSAGSQIAFLMAVRHPERVNSVVFECLGAQPDQSAMYVLLREVLQLGELPDFASWLFYLFTKSFPKESVKFILSIDSSLSQKQLKKRIHFVLHSKKQMKFAIQFIHTTMPIGPRIPGIENDISPSNLDPWPTFNYSLLKTPSMIIQSKYDSNGSYSEAQFAASQIPGAKFLTLGGCGHFIWLGKETDVWERQMRQFLRSHSNP